MMTEAEARNFRIGHDALVRKLSRMSRGELARLELAELRKAGRERLFGGPHSKDELIRAITSYSFPLEQLNESIHVLYHRGGIGSSACKDCHPHAGGACDCITGLAERQASRQ